MPTPDYDDPKFEEQWCDERRAEVAAYLEREGLTHGRIGEWPAWHIAPYVSVWAIESLARPDSVGWWAICGDLPTDYVSSAGIVNPRQAMAAIAERWAEMASHMERGTETPGTQIGPPEARPQLAPLLKARSTLLSEFVRDETLWDE